MDGNEFTEKLANSVQHAVLKEIGKGAWLGVEYRDRIKIDVELFREVYNSLDMERVKKLLKKQIEQHVADKILNAMATEMATDVKQILSQRELREDVRAIIREKVREVAAAVAEEA